MNANIYVPRASDGGFRQLRPLLRERAARTSWTYAIHTRGAADWLRSRVEPDGRADDIAELCAFLSHRLTEGVLGVMNAKSSDFYELSYWMGGRRVRWLEWAERAADEPVPFGWKVEGEIQPWERRVFSVAIHTGADTPSPTEIDLANGWRSDGVVSPPWWRNLMLVRASNP